MYHVYVTNYEELEEKLNQLPTTEEVIAINTAGTQVVVVTKGDKDTNKAEEMIKERQRLLEQMNARAEIIN